VLLQWWVPFWAPCLAVVAELIRRRSAALVIFICHNVLPHDSDGRTDRLLTRLALSRGDGYIVHSESDASVLAQLLPSTASGTRVRRTPLPEFAIGSDIDRSDARRALRIADDERVALFFGFVRPYKGLSYLVEALPDIVARVPVFRLVVAGEFWEPRAEYDRRIGDLGVASHVTIDDRYVPNEEVGMYFSAADLVVLPYESATQSAVVTLAAAFGRPVVTTRVGGLPDVVIDGRNGLVVAPRDPRALSEAIVSYFECEELRARLDRGVVETRSQFEWERVEASIQELVDVLSRSA
jgi:glycosyltransferase involved in cell wall biosynthesis